MVLANAYHLMLRPGADTVAALGGLHRFTGWDGHTLTDSGGFQVHSLRPKVDDDGVTFASVYDGAATRLTPESAVEVQGLLGADIQMVLDVCASLPATPDVLRVAVDRTAAWAARARAHHDRVEARPEGQALFGIVQGGTDAALRVESARADGGPRVRRLRHRRAVGGGAPARDARGPGRDRARAARRPAPLPDGRGGPGGHAGVDRARRRPVRLRRPDPGRPARLDVDLRRAAQPAQRRPRPPTTDRSTPTARAPPAPAGRVATCGTSCRWASRRRGGCCSIHNLAFVLGLMDRARAAIAAGTLSDLVGADVGRSGTA